jgi:hypothetical protein
VFCPVAVASGLSPIKKNQVRLLLLVDLTLSLRLPWPFGYFANGGLVRCEDSAGAGLSGMGLVRQG